MRATLRVVWICAIVIALPTIAVRGQTPQSADAAALLARLLDARGMDAVAAADPDEPHRFIAGLRAEGNQLLVIAATYPVPVLLEERLKRGEFRQVYLDLQGASVPGSRFFVYDLEANGLRPASEPDQPFDMVFEGVGSQTTFDGNWANQGITEAEYRARFTRADAEYARLAKALVAALRSVTS
jgi:hypothetical protein